MSYLQLLEVGERGIDSFPEDAFGELVISHVTNDGFFLTASYLLQERAKKLAVTLDESKIEEKMFEHFSERISEIAPVDKVLVAKEDEFYEFYIVVEKMTRSQRRRIIERECEIEREYPYYFDFHIIELRGRELAEVIDEDEFGCVFDKSEGGSYETQETREEGTTES